MIVDLRSSAIRQRKRYTKADNVYEGSKKIKTSQKQSPHWKEHKLAWTLPHPREDAQSRSRKLIQMKQK